ncbi:cytochrome c551 [Oceanobacillus halotolerans]|uniref:cytochrome c551 n=1 Tax=Oceanobacillus halotolerans TaxID=2663380 RepID=UPI0013DA1FCE|nr:cytochrome c [Oceanobacillus halotolerans]
MKKWLFAALFGSALVLGACGGGDDAADDGGGDTAESAAGEEIYESNCASCHGGDLSGGAGPDLTSVGADYSAEEIADIVENGTGSMPAQNVSGDDLDALSSWLAEKQ